jgi:alkanesulfonate monooxygenase SsuD/methylene tetrahydromethanopterin reductase-like flavin-dependent oxidoreductase (luciferase family)
MKISLAPGGRSALDTLVAVAPVAEGRGYYGLWRAEGIAWDAFTVCALWAERTTRIRLATGIVSAIIRQPPALARAALTVQELSRGRFRLGLGVGNNPEVPQPAAPLAEIARVAAEVRRHWREGLVPDVTQPAPPLWLAALRPRMVELATRVGDGVLLNWATPDYVREVRRRVGRQFPIACLVRCHAGTRAAALAALRDDLAFYRRLEVYRKSLALQGLDADRLEDEEALRLVIRERSDIAQWQEAGLDELVLRPIGADPLATAVALAPGG